MLKQMRSGTQSVILKFFLFGILMLATGGLVLMDYQGMFRSGYTGSTVASVDGDKITDAEFDRLLQTAIRRERMDQNEAYRSGFPAEYLQNEINQRILTKAVIDLGLYVADAHAAKQIISIIEPLEKQGMSKEQALQRVLDGLQVSEAALLQSQKIDIGLNLLMRALSVGIKAPEQMAQDAIKFRSEARRGEYFALTPADAEKVAKPSEEELQKFYKGIANRYMLPEYRRFALLVLDPKTLLGAKKETTEEEMKAWYAENKEVFEVAESRSISQLVVEDEAVASKLYAEAQGGKDLKSVADGAGKGKSTYVAASRYTEAEIPVDIAEAYKLNAGEVAAPVKTALGWIIARVDEALPAGMRPYEEVKDSIKEAIEAESANNMAEALWERRNEIDEMIDGGNDLAAVSKKFGVAETAIDEIDATGKIPSGKAFDGSKIPAFEQVLQSAFRQQKLNIPGQIIEAPSGELVLFEVREVIPAKEQDFKTVRADVEKAWMQEQHGKAVDRLAAKVLDKLKLGEHFEKVAKEFGQKITRTEMIRRSDHAKASEMEKGMFPALFSLDKIGEVTTVNGEGKTYILRLADRRIEKPDDPKHEEVESMLNMLDHSVQKDILEQYRMSLMDKYKVKMNKELLREKYVPEENGDGIN